MTHKKFMSDVLMPLFTRMTKVMESKGLAYSGEANAFANFQKNADRLGLTKYQVWAVYFEKHHDALCSWLQGKHTDYEPIHGRILDMMNYLAILDGMAREDGAGQNVAGSFIEYDPTQDPHGTMAMKKAGHMHPTNTEDYDGSLTKENVRKFNESIERGRT